MRVEHICYTDQIHAFLSFAGGIRAGDDACDGSEMPCGRVGLIGVEKKAEPFGSTDLP